MSLVNKKIILLSSHNVGDHIHDDHLFEKELKDRGHHFQVKPWEDLEDGGEDLFLIRTTWNYTDHYDEFIKKLETIEDRLWNPLSLVRWNSNKKYLLELYQKGLKVLPLILVHNEKSLLEGMEELGGTDFIIKPLIGASAKGLQKFSKDHPPQIEKEMILQKFYPQINEGEISMIYFDKKFSYAIKKVPKKGEIRVQEEYGGENSPYTPSEEELLWANEVIAHLPSDCLYARVDLLPNFGLMEVECIEPALYFTWSPEGAKKFVDTLEEKT